MGHRPGVTYLGKLLITDQQPADVQPHKLRCTNKLMIQVTANSRNRCARLTKRSSRIKAQIPSRRLCDKVRAKFATRSTRMADILLRKVGRPMGVDFDDVTCGFKGIEEKYFYGLRHCYHTVTPMPPIFPTCNSVCRTTMST